MKKKILILFLVAAYLSMAAACNTKNKSGSMADSGSQSGSVTQDRDDSYNDNSLNNNSGPMVGENNTNSGSLSNTDNNGITGTGGANGNDNDSLLDGADNTISDAIDDAIDGVKDLFDGDDDPDEMDGTATDAGTTSKDVAVQR